METQAVLSRLDPAAAARALAGFEQYDPAGTRTGADVAAICRDGECFEVVAGDSQAVYVVAVRNGVAWVQAAKGSGAIDLVQLLDLVVTQQAQGQRAIALQTMRRGLVRKLVRRGFRVVGWTLKRELADGI